MTADNFKMLRSRMVNFRVSEDEFLRLQAAMKAQGSRSLSEFARQASIGAAAFPASADWVSRFDNLACRLETVEAALSNVVPVMLHLPGLDNLKRTES